MGGSVVTTGASERCSWATDDEWPIWRMLSRGADDGQAGEVNGERQAKAHAALARYVRE